ncbi:hypothetical protein ACFV2H_28275 [Streptomyces sp. NPDC059629]|uniref:hypothetical protein n=1 Tax=Streptomyces sp. NPDC059629 TaxID=3346889 RepID=UPI0036BB3404
MHTPHRSRFRALLSAACCAVLGAGLPAGAGSASAAAPSAPQVKAGSKVVGYFTEWSYDTPAAIATKMTYKNQRGLAAPSPGS